MVDASTTHPLCTTELNSRPSPAISSYLPSQLSIVDQRPVRLTPGDTINNVDMSSLSFDLIKTSITYCYTLPDLIDTRVMRKREFPRTIITMKFKLYVSVKVHIYFPASPYSHIDDGSSALAGTYARNLFGNADGSASVSESG